MLYVIYNQKIDVDEVVTEDLLAALQDAGEIFEHTDDVNKYIIHIIDLTEERYNEKDWTYIQDYVRATHSLKGFINKYGVDNVIEPAIAKKPLINKEVYHNLDEEEQLEVLKFVPDGMLLSELSRRMFEYRKYSDSIREVGEEMKIYV